MEQLSRDILGKTTSALIDNKTSTGKVLAIANYSTHQQVCFQLKEGEIGVWIPALAIINPTTPTIIDKIREKAEQDLASLVKFTDNLVKNLNDKVASDIELINKTVKETQKLVEATTQEIAKYGTKTMEFLNQYLRELNSTIGKILNQISNTIQNVWNESWRQCIAMAMKVAEDYFDSAKKVVDNLRKEYPQEDSFNIAKRLINRSTVFSVGFGFGNDVIKLAESLTELSIGLDLAKNAAFLSELVYQVGIAYDFDDISKITKGEAIAIIGLCLGIDVIQQLGLKALTLANPVVSIPVKAISNVALFQLVGYASCLYFDIKVNGADNPLVSGKAYQEFTAKLQVYLDETLSETEKLAEVIKDVIEIKQKVPALAVA